MGFTVLRKYFEVLGHHQKRLCELTYFILMAQWVMKFAEFQQKGIFIFNSGNPTVLALICSWWKHNNLIAKIFPNFIFFGPVSYLMSGWIEWPSDTFLNWDSPHQAPYIPSSRISPRATLSWWWTSSFWIGGRPVDRQDWVGAHSVTYILFFGALLCIDHVV